MHFHKRQPDLELVSGVGWTDAGCGGWLRWRGEQRSEHSYKGLCPRPSCELQPCADKTVIVLLRGPRALLPLLVIYHTWQPHWTIITLPLSPRTVMSMRASGAEGGGREIAVRNSVRRESGLREGQRSLEGEGRESDGQVKNSYESTKCKLDT